MSQRAASELRLHFVGIGGIGMSGIAEVFQNQGYQVSGSDLHESEATRKLASLGVKITVGHQAQAVQGADVVVISSAVKASNPEVTEARKLRIPVIPRAEMLGELMRGKIGVAVAGTHGKTTTTSMLAAVLVEAGWDPTLVIGGRVDSLGGGGAKLGQGKFVVAEADESDGSFLHLPATYAVITNIDNDHLDHYGNLGAIEDAFANFVGELPFYGKAAVCIDDAGVRRTLQKFKKPYVTYGFSEDADCRVTDVQLGRMGAKFKVGGVDLQTRVPGQHNVLNAAGCFTIACQMGVPVAQIAKGILAYGGVKRRFEVRWRDDQKKQAIVDDYGHHPTEVAATLAAARNYWEGRIITVFQPHRYSRTVHCKDGFKSAFNNTDLLFVTDIYAAGEDPIEGVTAQALAHDIQLAAAGTELKAEAVGSLEQARDRILQIFRPGDLVLCLGAGSITRLPDLLIEAARK